MEQLLNIDLEKISNSSKQEAIDRKKFRIIFKDWFSKQKR